MAVITAAVDPVTRIEGHLKVEVEVDTVQGVQQVVEARSVGTLFRGFEKVLEGRDPRDATIITSRICGVCPTAHGFASALVLDDAFGVTPPDSARILRNLVHGACFIESTILHFYLLNLPDFIRGPGMAPWQPGWDLERRLDTRTETALRGHYLEAVTQRRRAHEMAAIYGGKLPHTPAFIAGGFTAVSTEQQKTEFTAILADLIAFIQSTYIPDVEWLSALFPEYLTLGRGYGNLLSFGVFDLNADGSTKLLRRGRLPAESADVLPVDVGAITEDVTYSWYADATNGLPPAIGETLAQHPKPPGYSWLKAPRYQGVNYEVGPLARMTVNGDYTNGVSVMDRHLARAHECLKIALAMQDWIAELPTGVSSFTPYSMPDTASGVGLTEAPRGALGHWLAVSGGKIARYQVVTPTCWNCSPRDSAGMRGPMEQALVGIPVANPDQPIEVLRAIHSFDPYLDCATHVMRPGSDTRVLVLGGPPG
jgi:hydrogenase large subunit